QCDRLRSSPDPQTAQISRAIEEEILTCYRDFLLKAEEGAHWASEERFWAYIRVGNDEARRGRYAEAIATYIRAEIAMNGQKVVRVDGHEEWKQASNEILFGERPILEEDYRIALRLCIQ